MDIKGKIRYFFMPKSPLFSLKPISNRPKRHIYLHKKNSRADLEIRSSSYLWGLIFREKTFISEY